MKPNQTDSDSKPTDVEVHTTSLLQMLVVRFQRTAIGIKVIDCPCSTQHELERKRKQVFHAASRAAGAFAFFTSPAMAQMLQMAMHSVTLTAETETVCVCARMLEVT